MSEKDQIRTSINVGWLILNYKCNNRCSGCYAQNTNFIDQPMPFGGALKIMSMLKQMEIKNCLLIGGEPTLYNRLVDMLNAGRKYGLNLKLITNGRKLANKQYLLSLIKAGLKHACISVEGAAEKTHNSITKTKSFHEVVAGIQNCLSLGLPINTLFTISRYNFHEIVPLAEMMNELGVIDIMYNIGLPTPNTKYSSPDNDFVLSPIEAAAIISGAFISLKTRGIRVKFYLTIPLCLIDPSILEEMIRDHYVSSGAYCHVFYGRGVAFEPNGNVLPCTHFANYSLFNMISDKIEDAEDFKKVWHSSKGIHGEFREAIWQYPHSNCKDCRHWGKCVGGCPLLWTHFDPNEVIGRKEV